jgi:hypothetical protein
MSVSLTGNDISIINDRLLRDLADGDAVNLDFPNNLAEGKKGKNGNSIISFNEQGGMVTVTIRVLLGSPDDKYLNKELTLYKNNRAGYILLTGEFVKKVGDGQGNVSNIIYNMTAGFVQKYPNAKENTEGDTEQAVTIYQIVFMNTDRSI